MRTAKLSILVCLLPLSQALAGTITYTSSAAFEAALAGAPTLVENYTGPGSLETYAVPYGRAGEPPTDFAPFELASLGFRERRPAQVALAR